jgi:xanthine dehydrogenase accessory factor
VIWGLGLGCDGELDLLLTPVVDARWIEKALVALGRFAPFGLGWHLEAGPAREPAVCRHGETVPPDTFKDWLEPPPDLIVIGAGDDAIPLVELASVAGFRVTVVDHRAGYLAPERFPRAYAINQLRPDCAAGILPANPRVLVVIKNHALEMDKQWARHFDATDVAYIGILGPRKRNAQIREAMTSDRGDRIYGPAGLDVGGEGAEQIAVSIVAELLSVWSGRPPAHLRERDRAIHG